MLKHTLQCFHSSPWKENHYIQKKPWTTLFLAYNQQKCLKLVWQVSSFTISCSLACCTQEWKHSKMTVGINDGGNTERRRFLLKTPKVGTSGLQFFCSLYISFLRILIGNLAEFRFWWISFFSFPFFFPKEYSSQSQNSSFHLSHLFISNCEDMFIHSPVLQSSITFLLAW